MNLVSGETFKMFPFDNVNQEIQYEYELFKSYSGYPMET